MQQEMIVHTLLYFARGENKTFSTSLTHLLLQHFDQRTLCYQKPYPPSKQNRLLSPQRTANPLEQFRLLGPPSCCSLCQQSPAQQPALQSAGSVCLLLRARLPPLCPSSSPTLPPCPALRPQLGKTDHVQDAFTAKRDISMLDNHTKAQVSLAFGPAVMFLSELLVHCCVFRNLQHGMNMAATCGDSPWPCSISHHTLLNLQSCVVLVK